MSVLKIEKEYSVLMFKDENDKRRNLLLIDKFDIVLLRRKDGFGIIKNRQNRKIGIVEKIEIL